MNRFLLSTVCVSAMFLGAGCKVTVVDDLRIPAYEECSAGTDQCEFGTDCFGIAADGVSANMCTDVCTSSIDCPTDIRGFAGECIAFPRSPAVCFEACRSSSECAVGWACKSATSDGTTFPPICLPI